MPESQTNDTMSNPTPDPGADQAGAAKAGEAPDSPAAESAVPGSTGAKTPEQQPDLATQLAAAKAEAAANYERFMRSASDLENFRRRTLREKDELRTLATGRVLEDIFPVMDNLGYAIAAAKQPGADVKSLLGGVEMVLGQLKSALASHGLKEINPAGQPFDPHQHEAISHAPSDTVKPEHVSNVVRTGFSLNGRLLRPASVVVSSGPASPVKG